MFAPTLTGGTNNKIIYYKNNLAESVLFQATGSGYQSPTLAVTINAQAASAMKIAGPSQVAASACSGPFVITPSEAQSNDQTFPSNTTLSLSGGGAGVFYSNANCITSTTTLSVTAGDANATFYYRNVNANVTQTFTVTDGNAALTAGTKTILTTTEVAMLTLGSNYTCALKAGAVYCWGINDQGQTGNGRAWSSKPVLVSRADKDVIAIASGRLHTCALLQDGTVKCWGYNRYGPLGDGTYSDRNYPLPVIGLPGAVVSISAGGDTTCALLSDQTVYCWGFNSYGQVGNANLSNMPTPTKVANLTGVSAIAVGWHHSCALVNGGVYCWGRNHLGQLGDGTLLNRTIPTQVPSLPQGSGVTQIATGGYFTCAVKDGGLMCWGENASGQVGDGTTTSTSTPYQLADLPAASGVTSAGGGLTHACAVVNGAIKCWGSNSYGEVGNSKLTSIQSSPVTVVSSGATAVYGGTNFTCGIVDGLAKCWGNNAYGQIGTGESIAFTSPQDVAGLGAGSGVTSIWSGLYGSCAVVNGGAKCWGDNSYMQIGDGTSATAFEPKDVQGLGPGSGVTQIDGYQLTVCALITGVGIKCWGRNYEGAAFGSNEPITKAGLPRLVEGLPSTNITAFAYGLYFGCAVINGGVYCWGFNLEGQLGVGDKFNRASAVPVPSLPEGSGVISVKAGYRHVCALLNDGTVKCWGRNGSGELGDGTNINRLTPVTATVLDRPATQIAIGQYNTCAILDNGAVKCWGYGGYGSLGDGFSKNSMVPVEPTGMSANVTHLAMRHLGTCVLQNGAVKCWGFNIVGQLGMDTQDNLPSPYAIPELATGVTQVAPGSRHTCFLINGGVKCMGTNYIGQMGLGTLPVVTTPSFVVPF